METKRQDKKLRLRPAPEDIPLLLALPETIQILPTWYREPLADFVRSRQRNWPAKRVQSSTRQLCNRLAKIGSFLIQNYGWANWAELSVRWLDAYIDKRLEDGILPNTINVDISFFKQLCVFLSDSGYAIPKAVLRMKQLTTPESLPRPLPGDDVFRLEKYIQDARTGEKRWQRDKKAFRDLAWFYLMWHCGLRVSEVCDLKLDALDFESHKLLVRDSKERKDRMVYMSETVVRAIKDYLDLFGNQLISHLFEHKGKSITTRQIQALLTDYGKGCGIEVSPHRLRHTFATQMLNAGMPITSLQRYLGHKNIDTTLIYTKVSDLLLQQQYKQALQGLDPDWHPYEQIRKAKFVRQSFQRIRRALGQLRENTGGFHTALGELQELLQKLEEDIS